FVRAFETGRPVLRDDVSETSLSGIFESRAANMNVLKSYAMVPISIRGLSLGVMTIGSTKTPNAFDPEDILFFEALSCRLAAAMETSRLYSEAKSAIKLRDEFLSIASHELKTPLTPLKLQIQQVLYMLSKAPSDGQFSKLLGNSEKHINRLTRLIEDLL